MSFFLSNHEKATIRRLEKEDEKEEERKAFHIEFDDKAKKSAPKISARAKKGIYNSKRGFQL